MSECFRRSEGKLDLGFSNCPVELIERRAFFGGSDRVYSLLGNNDNEGETKTATPHWRQISATLEISVKLFSGIVASQQLKKTKRKRTALLFLVSTKAPKRGSVVRLCLI